MRRIKEMSITSMCKACCAFDGMLSGVQNNAGKTFQVLRLPWMAEVLEPPGAAPAKTWKV
jgi:hypothetical protein